MSLFTTLDTLEYTLIHSLQNLDGTILDSFFMYMSNISLMVMTFGIIIAFMIWRRHQLWKPLLFAVIVSAIMSSLINEWLFKMFLTEIGIFRPRPWTIHPDILAIGHAFRDSSFPSSHMAFTTLLVMIVTYFEKRFLTFGILIIILMWLSRIHNGMHYPSDILIGTIMGVLYGYGWLWFMKQFLAEENIENFWMKMRATKNLSL